MNISKINFLTKLRFYIPLIIMFIGLIFTTCKQKCESYYLGSLVTMNPYSGTEELVFNVTGEDEVVFIGQGRSVQMNTVQPQESGEICERSEWDNCYFEEENGLFKIKLALRPTINIRQAHLDIIFIDYRYNDLWGFTYVVNFYMPLDKNNLIDGQTYHDSLSIYNSIYYEVFTSPPVDYKSNVHKGIEQDTIKPTRVYYNIYNGLLKIDFDDESTWELKEIRKAYN